VNVRGIKAIAIALLTYMGIITLDEAREMLGLSPMGSTEKLRLRALAKFMKETGKPMPMSAAWYWPGKWE
jgi:hypothetical protein